ncbi:hypothetical protein D3C77_275060 [compost metagenome]
MAQIEQPVTQQVAQFYQLVVERRHEVRRAGVGQRLGLRGRSGKLLGQHADQTQGLVIANGGFDQRVTSELAVQVVALALPAVGNEQVQGHAVAIGVGVGQQVGVVLGAASIVGTWCAERLAHPVERRLVARRCPGAVRVEQMTCAPAPGLAVLTVLAQLPGHQEWHVEEQLPEVQTVGAAKIDCAGRAGRLQAWLGQTLRGP